MAKNKLVTKKSPRGFKVVLKLSKSQPLNKTLVVKYVHSNFIIPYVFQACWYNVIPEKCYGRCGKKCEENATDIDIYWILGF